MSNVILHVNCIRKSEIEGNKTTVAGGIGRGREIRCGISIGLNLLMEFNGPKTKNKKQTLWIYLTKYAW